MGCVAGAQMQYQLWDAQEGRAEVAKCLRGICDGVVDGIHASAKARTFPCKEDYQEDAESNSEQGFHLVDPPYNHSKDVSQ